MPLRAVEVEIRAAASRSLRAAYFSRQGGSHHCAIGSEKTENLFLLSCFLKEASSAVIFPTSVVAATTWPVSTRGIAIIASIRRGDESHSQR